jgi:fructokinase
MNTNSHKVVCFGEVLWDILPSGAVPGGAPMNVAYHLHKLGKQPALITSVGLDKEGKDLLDIFSGHGVCTDFFQFNSTQSTGKVFAQPNQDNEMVYDIVMPVAWDHIKWEQSLSDLVSRAEYFVFGSLAARNEVSRTTLFSLLEAAKRKVLDINLRAPHYNRQIIEELLQHTDLLKLNIAELDLVSGWFSDYNNINERVQSIMDKFSIRDVVVTMGGDGAMLFMNGQVFRHNGFAVQVEDTVGSGDSFLAGLLSKLLDNAQPREALEYASALGAFIATQRGACPEYGLASVDRLMMQGPQGT